MTEIILGPPGTGKTTALLAEVEAELGRGTPPDRVGFVTFTRRAAEEAVTRACAKFNLTRDGLPFFRTLHSMCFRMLGLSREDVLDGRRLREDFAEFAGVRITGRWTEDGTLAGFELGDRLLFRENLARVRCVALAQQYAEDSDDLPWRDLERIRGALETFKQANGLLDYTDMLQRFVDEGAPPRLDALFVDECFIGDTPILLDAEGHWMTIRELVETKYAGSVLSWDPELGVVNRRVVNGKRVLRNHRMVQIKYLLRGRPGLGHNIVVCTEDHQVKTEDGWVAAGRLQRGQTVYVETAQKRVAGYQHRHKVSSRGKETLSRLLQSNQRGLGKVELVGKREEFARIKGGNGRGPTKSEALLKDKMLSIGVQLTWNKKVITREGRNSGYPPHYKLDFLIEETNTVLEVDGTSHRSELGRLQDQKKDDWLIAHGYGVIRVTNEQVAKLTPDQLRDIIFPRCFVEAEVLSVEDYTTTETYVYDLEVENTHCYFAHGLLVHNCQDLSRLQWAVVNLLSKFTRRVVVAGDDDQAIYAWAGADAQHLVHMEGIVRVLGQSYRCPVLIQALGAGIVAPIVQRRTKTWAPRAEAGEMARLPTFRNVSVAGAWGDGDVQPVLVLARNERVLREVVEPELRQRGVLYERDGRLSVSSTTLRAIEDWEALRAGGTVAAREVRRVYALMTSGRGVARGYKALPDYGDDDEMSLEFLQKRGGLLTSAIWHEALDRMPAEEMSYVLACLRAGERLRHPRPRVRISTIHGSKGGEARHVVVFREMARRTFREMERSSGEDERRVWYVAVTRARERLTIVGSRTREECPWV